MTERLTILHTNDVHGRLEGLARVATLVNDARRTSVHPVLYVDVGDIEDTSNRLSNLTKGVAMHRLLSAASCNASAVGNGGLLRYGPTLLERYALAATYPLFLANLVTADGSSIAGVQSHGMLAVASAKIGVIGLTDPFDVYSSIFGLRPLEIVPLVRRLALELRAAGAEFILVLSHLGWQHQATDRNLPNDADLARALQSKIDLVIGAHTHHLLLHGERIGRVWVAQAGSYAQHLGRIELSRDSSGWHVESCATQALLETVEPLHSVLDEEARIEAELEMWLAEPLCTFTGDLTHATAAECAGGNVVTDALRAYWDAEIGLSLGGMGFLSALGAGVATRGDIFERVPSSANPAVANLKGWQILEMLVPGLDAAQASISPKGYRGAARGLMHVSNLLRRDGQWFVGTTSHHAPLELERVYRVAASDAELEVENGFTKSIWNVETQYDANVIMREVLEGYMRKHPLIAPEVGRVQ